MDQVPCITRQSASTPYCCIVILCVIFVTCYMLACMQVLLLCLCVCAAVVLVAWAGLHAFRASVTCQEAPCCAAECLPFRCIKIRWVCVCRGECVCVKNREADSKRMERVKGEIKGLQTHTSWGRSLGESSQCPHANIPVCVCVCAHVQECVCWSPCGPLN